MMWIIRKMKKDDVAEIAELEKQCFSDPWSENSIVSELDNPLAFWIVAEIGGKIAGYIGSHAVLDTADIMNLAVSPDFRRQGVGEILVYNIIDYMASKRKKAVLLEVRVSNIPAISLYNKIGFVEVGRRPNYYRNPKEDAFILRKEL